MKTLLYIIANPKSEEDSVSRTVGREFIDTFIDSNPDFAVEEVNLYEDDIPEINHRIFSSRGDVADVDEPGLTEDDIEAIERIDELVSQFLDADVYVISAPMWSLSFPSVLKKYIDCIIVNGRTISISSEKVVGLLGDKERAMVYIQSSGGVYPKILTKFLNHGVEYIYDIFKFLGMKRFDTILAEGTDMPEIGFDKAVDNACSQIDKVVTKLLHSR